MSLYHKLPERSIRILDLFPGNPSSTLQGKLSIIRLNSRTSYEALSYTWGAPETAAFLFCENGSIPLTLNLMQALQRLRKSDTIRTLWIDQICINQNDIDERGQQVSLMGEIYRGASVVDVWLGEEDSNTSEWMQFIPHLLQSFTHPEERDETGDEVPHVLEALGILTVKSPRWIALRSLFERPYFRRMWIVQEVALGQECIVYCGSHSVSWKDLARAALCLEDDADHQAEAHRVVRMIRGLRRMNVRGHSGHRPLVNLVHQSFSLLCTNPRDKIYGVLGLASDVNPDEFRPDYSLSIQEVYLETTVFCMRRYDSLEVLCQVRHPKLLVGLPSWVPDWTVSTPPTESLVSQFGERYFASGKEGQPQVILRLSNDKRILYANGKVVDKIQEVGSVMLDLTQNPDYQDLVLSEWREYARKASPYFTGETYPSIFWRLLLADAATRGRESDITRQQLYEAFQNLIDRNTNTFDGRPTSKSWKEIAEMSIVNTRSLEFERLMNAACIGRRIAVTEQGFLSLVHSEARVGDVTVVLETVRVPLVLRRVGLTKDHELVGECFVQGWMDGGRFDGLSGSDAQFSIV